MSTQPTTDQPLVTHADLPWLTEACELLVEKSIGCDYLMLNGLTRLIAAAEADKPALPEGWVLQRDGIGDSQVLKHKRGFLSNWGSGTDSRPVADFSGTFTPLVTAASLVPEGWHVDDDGDGRPTVWDADFDAVYVRRRRGADPLFDVLAAFVYAAQAERGESR